MGEHRISISINDAEFDRITAAAKEQRCSRNRLIRQIIMYNINWFPEVETRYLTEKELRDWKKEFEREINSTANLIKPLIRNLEVSVKGQNEQVKRLEEQIKALRKDVQNRKPVRYSSWKNHRPA